MSDTLPALPRLLGVFLATTVALAPLPILAESCPPTDIAGAAIDPPGLLQLDFSRRDHIDTYDPALDRDRPLYFYLRSFADPGCVTTLHRYTADIGTDFATWLDERVPTDSSGSDRSLAIKITSSIDENVKDKILFSVVAHDSDDHIRLLDVKNERYVSFNFMLDPHYELPHNWALHLQAWQCCGGHPPFAIKVSPGRDPQGPVEFDFTVSNDAIEAGGERPLSIYKVAISRGEWHNIILKLKPRPIGSSDSGEIAVWLDATKKFSWRGYWGYTPSRYSMATKGLAKDNIGVELGIYRRRQSTTQTIFFDNIRFANTFEEVAASQDAH